MSFHDVVIFPNTLYKNNHLISPRTRVHIVEHSVFFTLFPYHKYKLILHRASMKAYADYIRQNIGATVRYYDHLEGMEPIFRKLHGKELYLCHPMDHLVLENIHKLAKKHRVEAIMHDGHLFMNPMSYYMEWANNHRCKLRHDEFYKDQRRKHNILITSTGKPIGGKWSFDTKNRESFPKNHTTDYKPRVNTNRYVKEAQRYVARHFSKNMGDTTSFYFPIDHSSANSHLQEFFKQRFRCFGPYQDAVRSDIDFGCHSVISALLNIGLLTPLDVAQKAEAYGHKHRIPMSSIEGFIRQIIGWREYVVMLYLTHHQTFEKGNYFNHRRQLSTVWYEGTGNGQTTGFHILDDLIDKAVERAYLHHIERLMYIGNWMLISKIHPHEVFRWFMIVSIDSYNWVMYPNVYGMSQYSVGDLMMTRPYFSSSAYIDRMSDYTRTKGQCIITLDEDYEWYDVWDAIYYSFIKDNRMEFKKNYAIARQVKHWDNKSSNEKKQLLTIAEKYQKKY